MKPSLALRLGPLAERDYRLLFSATTVTTLGDALAAIALAFAVLSDRIPRSLILVGASLVQATAEAGTGALVLVGGASIAKIAALQALWVSGRASSRPRRSGSCRRP